MLTTIFYSLLALDETVAQIASQHGHWLYLLLFLIIFAETGLVVFPFLPGDSLLFAAGALSATGLLRVEVLVPVLIVAAVLGMAGALQGARLRPAPGLPAGEISAAGEPHGARAGRRLGPWARCDHGRPTTRSATPPGRSRSRSRRRRHPP